MKVLHIFLVVCCFATIPYKASAQMKIGKHDFPNISKDHVPKDWLLPSMRHALGLPGVWGLGIQLEVIKPYLAYASAEGGFGWVIGKHESDIDKKWRPWYEFQIGYPLFGRKPARGTGKWVISEQHYGDKIHQQYYQIDVPRYHTLIPFVGFRSTPTNAKIYPDDSGLAEGNATWYSFNAPVIQAGLKYIVRVKGEARVRDSQSGKIEEGPIQTRFEVLIAVNRSVGEAHLSPPGYRDMYKYDGLGYELMFKIPVGKLNAIGSFDIGVRSLGINGKKPEQSAQLYIGNTFYF